MIFTFLVTFISEFLMQRYVKTMYLAMQSTIKGVKININ